MIRIFCKLKKRIYICNITMSLDLHFTVLFHSGDVFCKLTSSVEKYQFDTHLFYDGRLDLCDIQKSIAHNCKVIWRLI